MTLKPGIYRHYKGEKGGEYLLIGVAEDENNRERELVVYQGQYDNFPLYVRPLEQFEELVDWYGEQVPRFQWIREK